MISAVKCSSDLGEVGWVEGRVQMEVVDRRRGMLPLLEGRWKEVLKKAIFK